jgi:hypothetical protein
MLGATGGYLKIGRKLVGTFDCAQTSLHASVPQRMFHSVDAYMMKSFTMRSHGHKGEEMRRMSGCLYRVDYTSTHPILDRLARDHFESLGICS